MADTIRQYARRTGALIAAFAVLLAAAPGCAEQPDLKQEHICNEIHLDRAEFFLTYSQYTQTRIEYEQVFTACGQPDHPQALLGWMIAKSLETINDLTMRMLDLLSTLPFITEKSPAGIMRQVMENPERVQAASSVVGAAIETFTEQIRMDLETFDEKLTQLEGDPGFVYFIPSLPVGISRIKLLDAGGEYDVGEVRVIHALVRMLRGILDLLLAVDYNFDPFAVADIALGGGDQLLQEFDPLLILDVVAYLFAVPHNEPGEPPQNNFMGIEEYEGEVRIQRAGEQFGNAVVDLIEGISFMRAETDDQVDDLIALDHPEEGGEQLVIRFTQLPGYSIAVTENVYAIEMPITDDYVAIFQHIADNLLQTPDSPRISWENDLVPVISLLVVTILETGMLDGIINLAITQLAPDQPGLADTVDSILAILNTELVEGFIISLIKPVFELDLGYYFGNPSGVNSWMPAWITEPTSLDDSGFLFEWECPLEERGRELLCPDETRLVDTVHFPTTTTGVIDSTDEVVVVGQTYEFDHFAYHEIERIEKDGERSPIPYIPLRDASLGGIVWLNLKPIEGSDVPDEFTLADNYSFNRVILDAYQAISNLMGLARTEEGG